MVTAKAWTTSSSGKPYMQQACSKPQIVAPGLLWSQQKPGPPAALVRLPEAAMELPAKLFPEFIYP